MTEFSAVAGHVIAVIAKRGLRCEFGMLPNTMTATNCIEIGDRYYRQPDKPDQASVGKTGSSTHT
jgi:hypothetical protein